MAAKTVPAETQKELTEQFAGIPILVYDQLTPLSEEAYTPKLVPAMSLVPKVLIQFVCPP